MRSFDFVGFDVVGFDFVGFEPTVALQNFAANRFGLITGEAPSDAFAKAQVEKTLEGFQAALRIQSTVGTFVAETLADDPQKAIQTLSRRIRSQLRIWKRQRFAV